MKDSANLGGAQLHSLNWLWYSQNTAEKNIKAVYCLTLAYGQSQNPTAAFQLGSYFRDGFGGLSN